MDVSGKLSAILSDDGNLGKACHELAADIKKHHSRLLEVVEGLHDPLTDTRPNIRERGVRILVDVLRLLPGDFLTENELSFLLRFFTDRLKDHHSVVPTALRGIFTILQMHNVPAKLPDYLLIEMNQHVSCQTQLQADRFTIYNIISQLVKVYPNDLKQLGPDFIYQVISNIDGEKDPRNLMFLFGMMPNFLKTFSLGHLTEEMFDVFSCYFPVDFYSATSSPSSVTREQLAVALASCLTAVADFSEFCFPLIFEKLESTRKEAKLDCFYLLKTGFSSFPISSIEPNLPVIWRNIKPEVLPGADKDIREAALEALRALLHSLSVSPLNREYAALLTQVVQVVIRDSLPSLKEVEMNAFLPSVQLLLCVAEASVPSCIQVVTEITPVLQTQYYRDQTFTEKALVLQTITNFLNVCNNKGLVSEEAEELLQIRRDLCSLYLDAVVTENEEVLVEALCGLSIIINCLDSNSRCKLYDILAGCLKQSKKKKLRLEAITCFKKLAKIHTEEIMSNMVNCKLQVFEGGGDENFDDVYECCQFALCEIADIESFTTFIVPQFLDLVVGSHDFKKRLVGISCLRKLVEVPDDESRIHNFLYEQCDVVSCLVLWCFQKLQEEDFVNASQFVDLLRLIAQVLDCVMQRQMSSVQSDVVSQFVPWFLNPEAYVKSEKPVFPLNPASPASQTQLVILLEGLIGSMRQDVSLQCREELINILTLLSIETNHIHTHRSASRLIGNLINKAPNDQVLKECLLKIYEKVTNSINNGTCNLMKKVNAVWLMIWVTKALIMRDHEDAGNWISFLIDTLHDDSVSSETASGFEIIMKENEEFFTQYNFCNIRLLFRQHVFVVAQVKLFESHHNAVTVTSKCNHLLSLMHILQEVPRQALLADLPKVIPLLVESLSQQNLTLLLSALGTLCTLLEEREKDIIDYLNTFVTKFLLLSQFEQSMRVRIMALQCLYHLCFYPTESLLPYRNQVVRELCKCLDDKKRLVRAQAVRARSRWFLVGAPGEPSKS
ncbi:MMS19 nucleotide excision repair protein homolog [Schistocerca americana]|uniref:MMS19 nucleotide excision repair protein homolog n=1 Tax=Schistocerca americana TaxID=7009 RepID=UPI001F4FDB07|nr:MMS19 nucleotide excision repair protein homolog [Schistocerca americana]